MMKSDLNQWSKPFEMRITQGTQKDCKLISDLASETFLDTYIKINPENVELLKAYVLANFHEEKISQEMGRNGVAYLLMKQGDSLLGYAKTIKDKEVLEIEKLYIVEGSKGQGLGHKFYEHILAQAKHEKISKIHLGVYDQNAGAIRFYERLGFKKVSDRSFKFTWNGQNYEDNDWVMELDVVSDKGSGQSKKESSKQIPK